MEIRINSIRGARRFLTRVIAEIYDGSLDEQRGRAVIGGLNTLKSYFEVENLEVRISELEKKAESHNAKK